ncbi:hypothetical protein [Archangium minus]|uniref:hypothetical protein n=1 Tax=Archangium minus TaxID=83450 RepID=UPI0037BEE1CE
MQDEQTLCTANKYVFTERGRIPIKGKGEMTTYLLEGRRSRTAVTPGGVSPSGLL